MLVDYVCSNCSYSKTLSWKEYNPVCPRCGCKVVAKGSLQEPRVRAVEQRRADYEAHIEKTYREVWRWLERELGDGFTRERQGELIGIFNNPYDKS